jgi:hypothetical protein
MAAQQNQVGQFVAPEAHSISKVFDNSVERMPADLRLFVPDPADDGVYLYARANQSAERLGPVFLDSSLQIQIFQQ